MTNRPDQHDQPDERGRFAGLRPRTDERVPGPDDELPNEFFGPTTYEDALEDQRLREDYKRGRLYEVYVPSVFEGIRPGSEPTLARRVFVGWEEHEDGAGEVERHPLFVKEREWQEMLVREETGGLRMRLEAAEAQLAERAERSESEPGDSGDAATHDATKREEFYSVKRAAQLLDLSEKTVYKLIRVGELRAFQVGGQHRIPSSALDELQEARRSAPSDEDNAPAEKRAPLFNPNFGRDARDAG